MFYQPLSTLYLQKRDKNTKNGSKIHFCRHVSELIFFPLKASIKQYILIYTNCITHVYFLSGECVRVLQWLRHDTRDFHYWWPLFLPLGLSHDKPPQSFTHKCTHILSHANSVDAHTHTHIYCKTQRYSLFARPRLRAAGAASLLALPSASHYPLLSSSEMSASSRIHLGCTVWHLNINIEAHSRVLASRCLRCSVHMKEAAVAGCTGSWVAVHKYKIKRWTRRMTTVGVGSGLVLYLSRKGAESWSALSVHLSKAVELSHELLFTDSTDIPAAISVSFH